MDVRLRVLPTTIESHHSEAVSVIGGDAACGVVVLCDHATNHLPPEYGGLGLAASEFDRHIAYDIGAGAVALGLAARLGAPAVLSRFSRLLIDPNRGKDDPTLVMRISDGAVIPGNRHLDAAERSRRITRFYAPYHDAIARVLDVCLKTGVVPVIVSLHSFTPVWRGVPRPWHAGILWDKDPRLALPFLDELRADATLVVGDNEPYTGILTGDTMWQHATQRGLAAALVEIRQDLIATRQGQEDWSAHLAGIVETILAGPDKPALRRIEYYGSHSDIQSINPIS